MAAMADHRIFSATGSPTIVTGRLESASGEYKNAEYRISYDAKSATDSPVDLTLGLVNSVMTASVFTGVLWIGGWRTDISPSAAWK